MSNFIRIYRVDVEDSVSGRGEVYETFHVSAVSFRQAFKKAQTRVPGWGWQKIHSITLLAVEDYVPPTPEDPFKDVPVYEEAEDDALQA